MNVSKLFRSLFARVYLAPIVEGEGGGAETPTIVPHPQLTSREVAMQQIAASVDLLQAPDLADFDEETGTSTPRPKIEPPEPEPELDDSVITAPPAPPEPEVPAGPRMMSIVVDGQTIEVEESRILEAGKRTLQKDHAADRRLQEASETKRRAEALLAQAQRLSIPDANAEPDPAPSQDAPQQQAQATNGLDPAMLDTYLENRLYMRDAQKAAAKFRDDFPDIAADPHLMNIAAGLEQQRINTATALGEPLGDPFDAYRKHGEAVQAWLQQRTGNKPEVPADKLERKRTITAIPAVNAKAQAPQAPRELTTSEIIEQQRLARKAGRPVPR